jgi:hypothetical protein
MAIAEPMDMAPTRTKRGTAAIPAAISTPPNTGPTMEPMRPMPIAQPTPVARNDVS